MVQKRRRQIRLYAFRLHLPMRVAVPSDSTISRRLSACRERCSSVQCSKQAMQGATLPRSARAPRSRVTANNRIPPRSEHIHVMPTLQIAACITAIGHLAHPFVSSRVADAGDLRVEVLSTALASVGQGQELTSGSVEGSCFCPGKKRAKQ